MKYVQEEKTIGKAYDPDLMVRLLGYLKPYALPFAFALLMALFVTGAELGLPAIVMYIIDHLLTPILEGEMELETAYNGIYRYGLLYAGLLLGRAISQYTQVYLLEYAGHHSMYDLREEIYNNILHLPIDYHNRNPVGRLVTRNTNDVENIQEMYSQVLVALFKDTFMVIGILVIMATISWQLTGLILLLGPFAYWVTKEFRRRVRDAYRTARRKLSKLNSYLSEHLSGMTIIQLFSQEQNSMGEFSRINGSEFDAQMRQLKVYALFRPLVKYLKHIGTAIVLWWGGWLVVGSVEGAFTVGALYLFIEYMDRLFQPIQNLAEKYNILQKAMASAERIFDIIDEEPEPYDRGRTLRTRDREKPEIEFRDVWFSYEEDPNREDWVLRDISFTVKPGQRMALVGPTGAGKSTIIKLLLRFHTPQRGHIFLNGLNIRELQLRDIRSLIGVVMQDVFLFSGDVRENVGLKNPNITDQELQQALQRVHADKVVNALPDQEATDLKQRGGILSEGQKQLISFARALLHDPPVLVLDEATASVDSETEKTILDSIEQLMADRTSIAIAHRLSTIENSDRILVLHRGEIVERGTHSELMAADGLYSVLYRLQFQNSIDASVD